MKRYQIAILFFALGIFAVTFTAGFMLSKRSEDDAGVDVETYATLKVFFSNTIQDPDTLHCERTYPVERNVSRLSNDKRITLGELSYLALSELLEGPTEAEKGGGYFTSINEDAKVQKIMIDDSIVTVDFSALGGSTPGGNESIAGSCKVQAIRSQITETIKQFPEIKEVVISINGNSETILQP